MTTRSAELRRTRPSGLQRITVNLTSRTSEALEAAGVVERTAYQDRPERFEYHLTGSGRDLLSVLDALIEWGTRHAVAQDDPDRMTHYRKLSR